MCTVGFDDILSFHTYGEVIIQMVRTVKKLSVCGPVDLFYYLTGMFVGILCAISGVLAMALPIPIVVNNFAMFYNNNKLKSKQIQRKKEKVILIFLLKTIMTKIFIEMLLIYDRNVHRKNQYSILIRGEENCIFNIFTFLPFVS